MDRAESSDAALSGLDISGSSLSPGFGSDTRDYTASVLNSVDSVTVTPEARENSATVTVNRERRGHRQRPQGQPGTWGPT